jgi:glutathione peroxidase
MDNIHAFSARGIDGEDVPLSRFRGKVLLVVNVASRCGFTPQYRELEALYRELAPQGLVVLGFPCNQFARQEPGDETRIRQFCSLNYDVTFPVFSRIEVNGPRAHPLYRWLKAQAPGLLGTRAIKWNFTKFLVGRDGTVLRRYPPTRSPRALRPDIVAALGQAA